MIPSTTVKVDPKHKYTNAELRELADEMLREDSDRELCRVCKEEAKAKGDKESTPYGTETGHVESVLQFDEDGSPVLDDAGNQLVVKYPEYECEKGHRWYQGEGMARGTRGRDQILFEDHLIMRHKREIYTEAGIPDPSIRQGLFIRVYPEGGRKINTKEQREKHGAGFYKN